MSGVVIGPDGSEVKFGAHYWRHYVQYVVECPGPDSARELLEEGADAGDMAPCCVLFPDGTRVEAGYDGLGERVPWHSDPEFVREARETGFDVTRAVTP